MIVLICMSQPSRRRFLGVTGGIGAAFAQTQPSRWLSPRTKAAMDAFGLRYPIFQAGFGSVTSVQLALAVSNAGAMGALGSLGTAGNAREMVAKLRSAANGPFFVNIILQVQTEDPPSVLAPSLEAGARLIQFSWGVPSREAISLVRASGARFGTQVTGKESARAALDAGADYLVCQGTEAGGHVQAHRGLFESLPVVLEEAAEKHVIAAGGIGDGAGIFRALAAGASAAMLGTRFVATLESNAHTGYKHALIGARARDTALTVCFQDGWTASHRVLRNSTFVAWEAAGCPRPGKRPGEGDTVYTRPNGSKVLRYSNSPPLAGFEGRPLDGPLYAGESVESVKDIPSASDLVKRLWEECEAARRRSGAVRKR
jgi:nitronate monooxygenase